MASTGRSSVRAKAPGRLPPSLPEAFHHPAPLCASARAYCSLSQPFYDRYSIPQGNRICQEAAGGLPFKIIKFTKIRRPRWITSSKISPCGGGERRQTNPSIYSFCKQCGIIEKNIFEMRIRFSMESCVYKRKVWSLLQIHSKEHIK